VNGTDYVQTVPHELLESDESESQPGRPAAASSSIQIERLTRGNYCIHYHASEEKLFNPKNGLPKQQGNKTARIDTITAHPDDECINSF
jgi:hypothetical protein